MSIKPIFFGTLLLAFFIWFQISQNSTVTDLRQRIELFFYDLRLTATLPHKAKVDKRVVIVDINEASLRSEGRWPWPRNRLATLTNNLFSAGAVVVSFDVMFSEKERNSAAEVRRAIVASGKMKPSVKAALDKVTPDFDHDSQFSQALKQGDSILGYIFHRQKIDSTGVLPEPLAVRNQQINRHTSLITMSSYTGNIANLQQSARSAGFFSLDADPDGILRRAPLFVRYKNKLYSSLALETVRIYYLLDKISVQVEQIGDSQAVSSISLGAKKVIPTDGAGRVIIPYRGIAGSYHYISAKDVLNKKFPAKLFENTIVLVGTTAEGLFDLRATPMQSVYPGVEVHANIISGLLDNKFPVEPAWSSGANLVVLVLFGLLLAVLLPRLQAMYQILIYLLASVVFIAINVWLWSAQGIVLAIALPLILMSSLLMLNLAYGFFTESEGRNRLKHMFGQYVPPHLVAIMNDSPDSYSFEGESREMTVMFSDIVGFTTLSEKLSASELKTLLNRYFTPMTQVIFDNEGTIDKYVGDMIMAFWGAPVKDENHALHAVKTAFAMLQVTERLKKQFVDDGLPEISIGIGLNTGQMNVGDMGSEYRRAYTVIGDSVNLASRLEGLTRYYGVDLIIGENTFDQVKNDFVCRELDLVKVKGKTHPVHIYQPIAPLEKLSDKDQQALKRYHDALDLYRQQDWGGARELFTRLQLKSSCQLYQIYLERIEWFQANPVGRDWDGVYERRTK